MLMQFQPATEGRVMKLPIRNHISSPLTLFIEPYCDQYEIPPEGEAIVTLEDGEPYSLDCCPENLVTLWGNHGGDALVEIVSKEQNRVIHALSFVHGFLFQYGREGKAAARDLHDSIDRSEKTDGYVGARFQAYKAFREGFRTKAAELEPRDARLRKWSAGRALAGAYRAGGVAAYFNHRTRIEPTLIDLGMPPFETDYAQRVFDEADAMVS
jgi:hypothetical protein